METSSKLQENRINDDFVLRFGNFGIDECGSRALITPPAPAPAPRSVFSFLDSPSFQESSCWDPSPVPSPVPSPEPTSLYPTDIWGTGSDYSYTVPAPAPPVTAPLYHTDNWSGGVGNTINYSKSVPEPALPATASFYTTDVGYPNSNNGYLNEVLPQIFQLMSDQNGRLAFENLLKFCTASHLRVILEKFRSEKESFWQTALCEPGSRSIQAFVKKLKNTGMGGELTLIISESSYRFMTRKHAWRVIEECFNTLGDKPNLILHKCVFFHFHSLAMDPTGCLTINSMLDNVRGEARSVLLETVVKNASQLSFDPSGNYVVQRALSLRNETVTQRICIALRGDFVQLAQKKGGSFVVEKCLESSYVGRGLVIAEIFKDDKTLLMLAKNSRGNYVVQMALEVTRIHDHETYEKLVRVLQPRFSKLVENAESNLNKRRSR